MKYFTRPKRHPSIASIHDLPTTNEQFPALEVQKRIEEDRERVRLAPLAPAVYHSNILL